MSRSDRLRALRRARKAPPPLARYFVSRGWLHLILLTGVVSFVVPLLWMTATSMKTDDSDERRVAAVDAAVLRRSHPCDAASPAKPIGVDLDDSTRSRILAGAARRRIQRTRIPQHSTPQRRAAAHRMGRRVRERGTGQRRCAIVRIAAHSEAVREAMLTGGALRDPRLLFLRLSAL